MFYAKFSVLLLNKLSINIESSDQPDLIKLIDKSNGNYPKVDPCDTVEQRLRPYKRAYITYPNLSE